MVECLQQKDLEDLISIADPDIVIELERQLNGTGHFTFYPTVDSYSPNPFMPEHPYHMLQTGRQKDIPLITGVEMNAGAVSVALVWDEFEELSTNWTYYGPRAMFGSRADDVTEGEQLISNVTKHFYVGHNNFSQELVDGMVDLYSDLFYRMPAVKALEIQSEKQRAPVYFYEVIFWM